MCSQPVDRRLLARAFIALGGNLGDVLRRFCDALAALEAGGARVGVVSRAYRVQALTPAGWDASAPTYFNAVCEVHTELGPLALLHLLQSIEAAAGRVRTQRWGARPLDLDLLLYDARQIDVPGLIVPHPQMRRRSFVLQPLAEVAPDVPVPPDGLAVAELLRRLPDPDVGILGVQAGWRSAPSPTVGEEQQHAEPDEG